MEQDTQPGAAEAPAAGQEQGDGWSDWISPGPAAAFGVAGVVVGALAGAVGGDDAADELEAHEYSDEELDADHDGDVDMDDVTVMNNDSLITSMNTTTQMIAAQGAQEAQLDVIDAIYGND